MIKNLVFDFGRVLVDYDFKPFIDSLFSNEKEAAEFEKIFCAPDFVNECDRGVITFTTLMQNMQVKYPKWKDQIQEFHDRQIDVVSGEVPGMKELLTALKSQGFKIYGLSNWGSTVYQVMARYVIFKLLDDRIISSEELIIKPDTTIYKRLCSKFNLKAEECLFTDDKQINIDGAIEAGMHAILFKNAEQYEKELNKILASQKTMVVKHIDSIEQAEKIPGIFSRTEVDYTPIDILNWNAFPYSPKAEVALLRSDDTLLVHFRVEEEDLLGNILEDNGPVWTDSCVEMFFRPTQEGGYYNFECNCLGTLLLGYGNDRHSREKADADILSSVKRWTSLGRTAFGEMSGKVLQWEAALIIPLSAFFKHSTSSFDEMSCPTANFFKCGGRGKYEHYLSWQPILTAKPDYHQKRFFGKIKFI